MRDSFNNELQVGDRILCIEPREFNMHRKNQIGTIAEINCDRMIVDYDSADDRGWSHPELNIPSGHGNCLKNQDKFIKIETHTDVNYRIGDKVLCYHATFSNHPFVGKITQELTEEYAITDEHNNGYIIAKSGILFLLERTQYKAEDEIVVQQNHPNELIFGEGYNQSIPARIDDIDIAYIIIEIDDPSIGWQRNNDTNHSYWTLTNTKKLFPKEFSYSLPFVEYLKYHNPEFFNSSEQTNSTEGTSTEAHGIASNEIEEVSTEEYEVASNDVSNKPTPKLIHNYNYKPNKTRFCRYEDEEHNENNLYLGIELEISGSSQDSDNEEDAKEILKIIQKDTEGAEDSVYFKHDGSINGFEIVFHPHTVKAYNEYNWKEIFSTIRKLGYTNDDKKAGFHIHVSRNFFNTVTEQNEALAKMVFLMYKFKEEIEPLAGRKDSDYATYSAKALKRVKENDLFGTFRWYCDSCGKYSAINSQHKDTFEIRIFDGVTDKIRFMDILNFIENLCTIVKCTSITDITKVRLEDFMPFLRSIEG